MQQDEMEYAGFWVRLGATAIDSVLLALVTFPLCLAIYGWSYMERPTPTTLSWASIRLSMTPAGPLDFLINWVMPAVATVLFWRLWQASPGKMALRLHVVDARTGGTLSVRQGIGRYFAYLASGIPLFMGFVWIAFDPRKQGWHDKLAGTVVVREKRRGPEPVRFGDG